MNIIKSLRSYNNVLKEFKKGVEHRSIVFFINENRKVI